MESKRAPNFTSQEIDIMLNFLKDKPDLVSNTLGRQYETPYDLRRAWGELTNLVNSSGSSGHRRRIQDIRKKWKDLKFQSKKQAVLYRSHRIMTGRPPPKKLAQVLSSVNDIIRNSKCTEDEIKSYETRSMKENCAPEIVRITSSAPETVQMIVCNDDGEIISGDLYTLSEVPKNITDGQNDTNTEVNQAVISITQDNAPVSNTTSEDRVQSASNSEEVITIQSVRSEKDTVPSPSKHESEASTKPRPRPTVPVRKKIIRMPSTLDTDRTINKIRYVRNEESRQKSHDEFEYFGQNIACQLRQLPLEVALQCQSDILSLVQKRRIECMRHQSTVVSKRASEELSNPLISPDANGYLHVIYEDS